MVSDIDHRQVAHRLDLLHFQDEAPGMVFWHPRGLAVLRKLEEACRRHVRAEGYVEVRTPQLVRRPIWERSGHWEAFREAMFHVDEAALKPVSCPGHIQIVRHSLRSYRDLPLRVAELGLVHRDEPGGSLHGLLRLRQFTQDDGHVFCAEDQVLDELVRFCRGLKRFYAALGFEALEVALSTRPEVRLGDDDRWDLAEDLLAQAASEVGWDPVLQPGGGAFYGPKIELAVRDAQGRAWQCGTVQVDLVLPERFDLSYADAEGALHRPVLLHRALCGSLERFLGLLLERWEGRLPPWLAPEPVRVLSVAEAHADWAAHVAAVLRARGVEAQVDARDERLGRKVAEAHASAVPFVLIVGERECAARGVMMREGRREVPLALDEAIDRISAACEPPR